MGTRLIGGMNTCRHLRFLLPREDADELRDADPAPCEICDALPHRRRLMVLQGSDPRAKGECRAERNPAVKTISERWFAM